MKIYFDFQKPPLKLLPLEGEKLSGVSPMHHKPSIPVPDFCLFISSISAIQMGKSTCDSVCVIWSSRWVRVTNCCVCRHLPRDYSESCLSVLLFCSHAPLSGRVLACKASPNLTRILSRHPHSAVFQYGCQSVMCLPSEGALIVLKNGETEKQGGIDSALHLLSKDILHWCFVVPHVGLSSCVSYPV